MLVSLMSCRLCTKVGHLRSLRSLMTLVGSLGLMPCVDPISRRRTRSKSVPGPSRRPPLAHWDTASGFYGGILGVNCSWLWLRIHAQRTWVICGSGCLLAGRIWRGCLLCLWLPWCYPLYDESWICIGCLFGIKQLTEILFTYHQLEF